MDGHGPRGCRRVTPREVARPVGLRQQSRTRYFPTKQALFDAVLADGSADGFADVPTVLDRVPAGHDPIEAVVAVAEAVVEYCGAHPARYHLMMQGAVPGFAPGPASHEVALGCLGVPVDRLATARVTEPGDVALVGSRISGLAAEKIATNRATAPASARRPGASARCCTPSRPP